MGYSMLHAGGGQRLERVRECSVPYFVKNVNAIKGKTHNSVDPLTINIV